jgi:predicted Zn-dependent protease
VQAFQAEALAGQRAAVSLEQRYGGVVRDAAAEARMQRVAARLLQATPVLRRPYNFRLLASTEINAVSLPASRIYVTRGLYERLGDDALLAATLAHEMAHLDARDSFRPPCTTAAGALDRECQADGHAAGYLRAAGFSQEALDRLLVGIADVLPAGWCEARRQVVARADSTDNF